MKQAGVGVSWVLLGARLAGTVATWAARSLEDGRVSSREMLQLVEDLAGAVGIPLEIVPDAPEQIELPQHSTRREFVVRPKDKDLDC